MDNKVSNGLAINKEAIVQIAGMAALEVDGVSGLGKRPKELRFLKSYVKGTRNDHTKSVIFSMDNGVIILDVFINVSDGSKVKNVAEAVQQNVKEKVQNMTGNAVARINVHVNALSIDK